MNEIVKAIAPINKEAQTVLKTSMYHRVEGQATTGHSCSTLFPVWDRGIEIVSKREISSAFSAKQTKPLSACQHLAIRKTPKKKIRKTAVLSHHSNQELISKGAEEIACL
ncbi:hypothetical protein BHYA_0008g00150 [Botrytis hyacinthi]|uniref:Uncharacterized protein n=1 Tax=Botrytis hyacinthi TaxID=278943 RepID=A0A4Z1H0Q7_9HELO|nr:hypothetical protein BHYA_0008g00150 [Botrytis hyacinthi]